LSRTIPRVWVDVSTDNIIASGFIGPQITVGLGPLRPYLHGGVGLSYFSTYSSVHGDPCCIYHPVVSSTNFDDWVPALTGGGGLYLALSRSVMIDITGQYVHNGRVEYMREGGITEDPDGSLWYEVIESEANMWIWKFGVSFGIG
jgi:opacity protein-like surface antigen